MGKALTILAGLLAAMAAQAQDYPIKPVRIITGSAGNFNDVVARRIAQGLAERWGQPFVVENRPGAGLTIGTAQAAKAAPDGYTLLLSDRTALSVAQSLHANLSYDPVKDLAPITLVASTPLILIAHPSVPAANFGEFVQYLKRQQPFDFFTSGGATGNHMANEQLKHATGIDVVSVHYKGSPPAMTALLAGEVKAGFMLMPLALAHVRNGKVRAYAVTSSGRFAGLPGTPTVAELGMKDVESEYWLAMMAPAGTPRAIIDKLNREIVAFMSTPAMRESLITQGADPKSSSPEELAQYIASEATKWKRLIQLTGMRVD